MFETEHLILRRFSEADIEPIYAIRGDAEMMRFIREPQDRAETANWIKLISSRWETDKIGLCAVVEKASGQVIGWCGLWQLIETGEDELGYAIIKDFQGKGYASEAAEAFLSYGFNTLKLDKIVAVARQENTGSRRVMEKLGMKFDYIGQFYDRDLVHYSITKEEFYRLKLSAQ
jgi:RimJ/RimL family protein N-acetyltransferase